MAPSALRPDEAPRKVRLAVLGADRRAIGSECATRWHAGWLTRILRIPHLRITILTSSFRTHTGKTLGPFTAKYMLFT